MKFKAALSAALFAMCVSVVAVQASGVKKPAPKPAAEKPAEQAAGDQIAADQKKPREKADEPKEPEDRIKVRASVDAAVKPVMEKYGIPGMAVGVSVGGKQYLFDYGVASKKIGDPIAPLTLFEIGSVSKTFLVTLASYAQENGRLSLSDKAGKYLPSLQGTAFGDVSLVSLGTHTPGGFPLQLPPDVGTTDQLMTYLAAWEPEYKAGTTRTYANPSIGMLGVIVAKSMNRDFVALMENDLFPALGLKSTYISVPKNRMDDYAQGYKTDGDPARMSPALLAAEAYGVRTTSEDLLRFVEANMGLVPLEDRLARAIEATHTGYFTAGEMTQDLIWEQYDYPAGLKTLLDGNSSDMLKPVPVKELTPPRTPRADVWINKTGSTNGFGAYVAFVPAKRLGVVLLANRNYPNAERVAAAYKIMTELAVGH
jgi:beta-lactamase class C